MTEQIKGTLTLKRKTLVDIEPVKEVEVMDSCKSAQFKCQCHVFKTVMSEHNILPSTLSSFTLQRGRDAVKDVREGYREAKVADVYATLKYIEHFFGKHAADKAKALFDEWLPKDALFTAQYNKRKH
jgi:hypothetical protein